MSQSPDPKPTFVCNEVTRRPLSDEMRAQIERDVKISQDKRWAYKKLALGLYELGRDWPPLDLFVQPHTITHESFALTTGWLDEVDEGKWQGPKEGHFIELGLWQRPGEPRKDFYEAGAREPENRLVLAEWWEINVYIPDDGDIVVHPELKGFALLRQADLGSFLEGARQDTSEEQE